MLVYCLFYLVYNFIVRSSTSRVLSFHFQYNISSLKIEVEFKWLNKCNHFPFHSIVRFHNILTVELLTILWKNSRHSELFFVNPIYLVTFSSCNLPLKFLIFPQWFWFKLAWSRSSLEFSVWPLLKQLIYIYIYNVFDVNILKLLSFFVTFVIFLHSLKVTFKTCILKPYYLNKQHEI